MIGEENMASDLREEPNRKEAKQISFRVSESEYEKLQLSAATLNRSVPAFVKKKAEGARLVAPKFDKESRQAIVKYLSGVANNINQIARYCNQHNEGNADWERLSDNIAQVRKEVNALWQRLS